VLVCVRLHVRTLYLHVCVCPQVIYIFGICTRTRVIGVPKIQILHEYNKF